MSRPISSCAVAIATVAFASCSGGAGEASLPTAVALSPDGVRHEQHSFSPDGRRIAYWSPAADSAGSMQLWVANADLTAPVKLPVTAAVWVTSARWSPDGGSLAAASSEFGVSQVVIVPAAGGDVRRVTAGASVTLPLAWFRHDAGLNYWGTAPGGVVQSFVYSMASGESRPLVPGEKRPNLGSTSPDGSHVAYFVIDGDKNTVWVADALGQKPRQLTTEGFESLEQAQEWSPSGKELLYQSRRTGHTDLWVVPIAGGPARQLTRDVRNDYGGVWSSDGRWIAFLSNRGRQTDVWVVPAAGGAEQRVTDSTVEEVGPMAWRPGTETLTFGVRTQKSGVWAMDLADGKERQLTSDSPRVIRFQPSADGRELLYVVDKGGGIRDLVVTPIAGGGARVLVEGGGTVQDPRWSPTGQQIAFSSDRGGSEDIWIVDVSGGAPRQLTSWPGYEGAPAWTHDGSALYFEADRDSKLGDIWRVPSTGGDPTRVTTSGNLNSPRAIPGAPGFLASTISPKGGQIGLARFGPDGKVTDVWDKSSVFLVSPSPGGDTILADVEQGDGKMRSMLLKTDGSGGRAILPPGQGAQHWSKDGQWVLYGLAAGGANDLALLRLADGSTRRLTTTPESEEGAEFTADGKTVLFRRVETVQRITAVDLSKLLAAKR